MIHITGHEFEADPPWSERMVCRVCGVVTTYCTTRRVLYGEEFPPCTPHQKGLP